MRTKKKEVYELLHLVLVLYLIQSSIIPFSVRKLVPHANREEARPSVQAAAAAAASAAAGEGRRRCEVIK
jgi:hypothetical protein